MGIGKEDKETWGLGEDPSQCLKKGYQRSGRKSGELGRKGGSNGCQGRSRSGENREGAAVEMLASAPASWTGVTLGHRTMKPE